MPLNSGQEYIIRITDGRILLKTVERLGNEKYLIYSYDGPPEKDVDVIEAHAVLYVRRA